MTRCESTLEGASSMMLSFAFRILSHLIFWLDLFFLLIFVNCYLCCKLTILCPLFLHYFSCTFMYVTFTILLCTYLNVQHLCDKIKSKPWLFMLQTMMPISVV